MDLAGEISTQEGDLHTESMTDSEQHAKHAHSGDDLTADTCTRAAGEITGPETSENAATTISSSQNVLVSAEGEKEEESTLSAREDEAGHSEQVGAMAENEGESVSGQVDDERDNDKEAKCQDGMGDEEDGLDVKNEDGDKILSQNNNEVDLTDIDIGNSDDVGDSEIKNVASEEDDGGIGVSLMQEMEQVEESKEEPKQIIKDEKKVEKFEDNRTNVMQYEKNSDKIKVGAKSESDRFAKKIELSDTDGDRIEDGDQKRAADDLETVKEEYEKHRLKHPLSPLEEEEENFMVSALCTAAEEGNLAAIQALLDENTSFDVNTRNKHGETIVHMAASGGHLDIIKYMQTKDADIQLEDKSGDDALFWAARQGHVAVMEYLLNQALPINKQNKSGETALHLAARYGQTHVIEFLAEHGADANLQDKDGETALHCAASRGNLECVRCLLAHKADINITDKRGCTALHLSTRRRHVSISLLLLHGAAHMDAADGASETPLHAACREGLLPIVQTMCAFGCDLEVINKAGHSPLHIAARSGHIEIARCLLLSGAEPDTPNKDGVSAEIMALAQGHNDVAELLSKLRPEKRDACIKQLTPVNTPLNRIKMKVFGNSGVGKSTLIDSLKCGYFGSFFRKARLSQSNSVQGTKPKGTENGSSNNSGAGAASGGLQRHHSLPTQLSYEVVNEAYTRGIDVQQINISGGGDLSVWEFSGYEPYFMLYDHFIGDPNCIHMIMFSLEDALEMQQAQVLFWLHFVKARMAPMEPIGEMGRQPWPAKIILVATHADKLNCPKDNHGEFTSTDADAVLNLAKQYFWSDFDIVDRVFVVDSHLAMSPELKALRTQIAETKNRIVKNLPYSKGFLDAVVQVLPQWRKVMGSFPVVTWPSFIEYVRAKVNLLASEEHMKEVMCQLQLVGEVIYVETDLEKDLVVLNPRWLTVDVIGHLLSHETITHSRPTGCFSQDDFQFMLPDTEAQDLLPLLEALEICIQCDIDGDIEYEFPCLNFVETLSGLWDKDDRRFHNAVYGGVRIQTMAGMKNQLMHMFPRLQVHLRKDVLQETSAPDSDLYQWYHGSKYCNGSMEAMITLEHNDQVLDVKCRGPEDHRAALYYFLDDLCDIIEEMFEDSCPGVGLMKLPLSVQQLQNHIKDVYAFGRKDMLMAQLENSTSVMFSADRSEEFVDLVAFGSPEVKDTLTLGLDLHISHLPIQARRALSMLLDPTDPMGRDWCMLAVTVGLTEELPQLDHENKQTLRSRTDRTMERWARDPNATIRTLVTKLSDFGRTDAADAILSLAPLYHVFQNRQTQSPDMEKMKRKLQPALHDSENTLASSVSR